MQDLMPKKLKDEELKLVERYDKEAPEGTVLLDFVMENGSKELTAYLTKEIKRKAAARAKGIIIN